MSEEKQGNLFIRRPKLAIVISLAILLAGILMINTLPLEEYPSITPPQVVVSATYAGASSDVIESTIAAPVEAQLNGVQDMIYMSSTSQNGAYILLSGQILIWRSLTYKISCNWLLHVYLKKLGDTVCP